MQERQDCEAANQEDTGWACKGQMNQQKKNHKILNQADKISLRYEHSNSVQGYEKQEHYNATYIASKQNYKETTEGIMQMEFLAHETASMDLCFNEMMNDRNKVLRTGANMLECLPICWIFISDEDFWMNFGFICVCTL